MQQRQRCWWWYSTMVALTGKNTRGDSIVTLRPLTQQKLLKSPTLFPSTLSPTTWGQQFLIRVHDLADDHIATRGTRYQTSRF